jgi:hypothetical protein
LIPYTFPDGYISGAVQVKEIEWLKDRADVYSLDDGFSHTAVVGNILVGNNKGIYDS